MKKSSAIAAMIWKPLSSDGSDHSDCSNNDRWDRLQFYLSDRGDRSDHMEATLQRSHSASQRPQIKYRDALRTLTLFKMAANTNIEKAIVMALFMEEVQKYDCLYIKFSKEYRDKCKKINCWKTIGEKFDLFPEQEFSVFPVDNDYKKTHLK